MADSFADLWNSSAPNKPTPLPQKLGSANNNSGGARRPQQDVFSLLASTSNSNPSSRSITPALSGHSSRRTTPNPTARPTDGSDAFSSLFSGSAVNGNGNARTMTIAERAAEAERLKLESHLKRQQTRAAPTPSAWDGLDSLASSTVSSISKGNTTATTVNGGSGASLLEDDWGLDSLVSSQSPNTLSSTSNSLLPAPATGMVDDDDLIGGFPLAPGSRPQVKPKPAPKLRSQPVFEAIGLTDTHGDDDNSPPPRPARRRDSPGQDFNFGDREKEDALLDDDSNDEEVHGGDDILGALSRPVEAVPKRTTGQAPKTSRNSSCSTSAARSTSPPPHIIGQIVEMGFSPQQARVALAATDTGLDLEAALEMLLSNGAGAASSNVRPRSPLELHPPDHGGPRNALRQMQSDRERQRSTPSERDRDKEQRNIQEQADNLLAQASEIGLTVFSKASSFWKEGKERVQKVYIERTASTNTNTVGSGPSAGRPRWMTEGVGDGVDVDPWKEGLREPRAGGGFRDEVEGRGGAREAKRERPQQQQRTREPPEFPDRNAAGLFSGDTPAQPAVYASPFRWGKEPPASSASAASSSSSTPAIHSTPPRSHTHTPASAPVPPPRAPMVTAQPAALALAAQHKSTGTAAFKLGQFAAAESAYTSAIATLPAGHLLLVPLHNNRALAKLRIGDYGGAGEDAGVVVELVNGMGGRGKERVDVGTAVEEEVDLGDALVKALKRRAEAWEGREKWQEAGRDWGALAGSGMEWAGAKVREEAARGVGRCRRMAGGMVGGIDAAVLVARPKLKPIPAPKPKPKATVSTTPSQALHNLRTATNAAEAEDQERHELKDTVDARLLAWKGGKESNIRALLGSLDTVLWPELGVKKVGMAELVTPTQVKVGYMKVIGRLHPDKLNAGNTTVEQRMLANGVFGALNEAWNASK